MILNMAAEGEVSFQPGSIFEGVSYTVIPSDDLSEEEERKVRRSCCCSELSIIATAMLTS